MYIFTFLAYLHVLQVIYYKSVQAYQYNADEIADIKEKTEEFVQKILSCRDIVGMNIAVVHKDQTLFTEGYGYMDLESKRRPNNESLFGIASLTKAMAAFSLGKTLHNEGFFWDTPIKDMLRDFETDDHYRTWHATSRDIASHRMGLPTHNYIRFGSPSRQELFEKLKYLKYTQEFRTSFLYNNLMYGLMTYITEELDGDSWEDVLRDQIFEPLNMTATSFTHEANLDDPSIAKPYRLDDSNNWKSVDLKFHRFWGELGGSGSVISNANDMAKWIKLHINKGYNEDGESVIDEQYLQELHTPSNLLSKDSRHDHHKPDIPVTLDLKTYGLGWKIGTYRGYSLSTHTGTSWGYGGLITLLHEPGIAIYTGITGKDPNYTGRYLVHFYMIDQLLKEQPSWPDISHTCSYKVSNKSKKSYKSSDESRIQNIDLKKYVGTYGNNAYGNVSFDIEIDHLKLNYGKLGRWKLTAISNCTFYGEGLDLNWMVNLKSIDFHMNLEEVNEVTISFDKRDPPTFIRDFVLKKVEYAVATDSVHSLYFASVQHILFIVSTALLIQI